MRPQPRGGLVDVHAHAFRAATVLPRMVDELAPAERDEPVEALWAVLEPHDVSQVVLVPLAGEDAYLSGVLADSPAGAGQRAAAVLMSGPDEHGLVPGVDPVAALRSRLVRLPARGVRTRWLGRPGRGVRDSPMWPVLEHMAATGLVLWTYLPPEQLPLLAELVTELPELPVLLNHLGFAPVDMQVDSLRRPWFRDPLPAAHRDLVVATASAPEVRVMLSGLYALSRQPAPYRDLWPAVRELRDAFGPRRMLFGSDFPWPREEPGYPGIIDAAVQSLGHLPQHDLDAVFGDNARALLGLPVPEGRHRA